MVRRLIIWIGLIGWAALGSGIGGAYGQAARFGHVGLDEGLSQNGVNAVYQDRIGFVWLGTQDGLNRYDGVEMIVLHEFGSERVELVRVAPNTQFPTHAHEGGEEILVLEGTLWDEEGESPAGSWVRTPDGSQHAPFTRADGTLIYVKFGHLA